MEQQSNDIGRRGVNIKREQVISRVAREVIRDYGGSAHTLQIVDAVGKQPDGIQYSSAYDVKSVLGRLPYFRIIVIKGSQLKDLN